MKYVFFLSLLYKHFKKPCSFRIYLDDVMVDEVVLDKDINPVKDFEEKYVNDTNSYHLNRLKRSGKGGDPGLGRARREWIEKYYQYFIPKKIWIYQLDIKDSNKNISLEFDINDNNHTNGFMTKSSWISLQHAGLIKQSIFDKSTNFFMECRNNTRKKFFYMEKHRRKRMLKFPGPVPGEHGWEPGKLPGVWWEEPNCTFKYPAVNRFPLQIVGDSAITDIEQQHRCGGNFLVKLNLIKKHKNMIIQECSKQVKGVVDFDPYIIWLKQLQEVINIYNEDQRSNHTKD